MTDERALREAALAALPALEEEDLTSLRMLPLNIKGRLYKDALLAGFIVNFHKRPGIMGDLARFLLEWQARKPSVLVHTSGSTGTPKELEAEKCRMAQSARRTCSFLGLKKGDTALLCMPLSFIAGRMVVVRALVCGLSLVPVEPCASPLASIKEAPVFAAMTPMQAWESLKDPETAQKLAQVRHLLLGGGAISTALAAKLAELPCAVWSSYGMTETLSHIALRRVNGPEASEWYEPLPGYAVQLSEAGTLIVHAPAVCASDLVTEDVAELDDAGRFRILGRLDAVINSGGIKIQAEEAERLLAPVLPGEICITAIPDERLGEACVLLHTTKMSHAELTKTCKETLPQYWAPKKFLYCSTLPHTATGKLARAEAKNQARKLLAQA